MEAVLGHIDKEDCISGHFFVRTATQKKNCLRRFVCVLRNFSGLHIGRDGCEGLRTGVGGVVGRHVTAVVRAWRWPSSAGAVRRGVDAPWVGKRTEHRVVALVEVHDVLGVGGDNVPGVDRPG